MASSGIHFAIQGVKDIAANIRQADQVSCINRKTKDPNSGGPSLSRGA